MPDTEPTIGEVPPVLYKYLPASRYEALTNRELRYSQPEALNDPFEARPGAENEQEEDIIRTASAEALYRRKRVADKFPDVIPFGVAFDLKADGARVLIPNILYEQVNRSFGILSLSKVSDSLLMWSHYCTGHNGFLIGFDSSHEMFRHNWSASSSALATTLRAVDYHDSRPEIEVAPPSIEAFMNRMFFVKGSGWQYEQEWRHIRQLREATRVVPGPDGKHAVHLFGYPHAAVREVVLGARLQPDVAQVIRDTCQKHFRDALVKELQIDSRRFQLRLAT